METNDLCTKCPNVYNIIIILILDCYNYCTIWNSNLKDIFESLNKKLSSRICNDAEYFIGEYVLCEYKKKKP